MRIGMMVDVYKAHVSGVTHYVELNKRHLEQAGHEVYVFTFGNRRADPAEPEVVYSPGLPLGSTHYFLALRYSDAARRLLQTMDVAHVQHPFVSGRLAIRYCKPAGIPIVFTNHTRYDLYARAYLPWLPAALSGGLLRSYMPRFCRSVDLVISPSASMAEILREMGVTSRIEVVPNGVEVDQFQHARPLRRADFGYTDQDVLLTYMGRVASEKNLEFLLRAFAVAAGAAQGMRLLVIGGGPVAYETRLRRLAAALGIEKRVRFTGMVPHQDLPGYLLMCDAFVTPSVTEVHPLSLIEAMACGLPVVGIRSPGISDTVEHGRTGLLSAEDLQPFADNLARLGRDRALRSAMGKAAREVSGRYAIERTTGRLIEAYERLLQAPSRIQEGSIVRMRADRRNGS